MTGTEAPKPVTTPVVLVGVIEGQAPIVVQTAAQYAIDLSASLVVVHVDPERYLMGEYYDGMSPTIPLAVLAEADGAKAPTFPAVLTHQVEAALEGLVTGWETRAAVGDPSLVLTELAEELDARLIVVGTRQHGVLAGIAEFLAGSVAVHLAHRQHRPILVVPLAKTAGPRLVPWETTD